MRDQVYSKAQNHIVDFAFTADVAAVFPDMIRRSVPGYETIIPVTGLIAARALTPGSTAVDLGCSLGATTQAIAAQTEEDVQIIGIDNSEPMIEGATKANQDPRISFVLSDAMSEDALERMTGAQVIVMNFMLQFCEPSTRTKFLTDILSQMASGGLLILSEKVMATEPALHEFFDETHLAWKRANGYSDLEVSQKRTALENVMQVDSEDTHTDRLQSVGFENVRQWYKCMNWASFIAWKP